MVHSNQTLRRSQTKRDRERQTPDEQRSGRQQKRSGIHGGQRFFRVVVVHEGLLDVEIGGQMVLVELHV